MVSSSLKRCGAIMLAVWLIIMVYLLFNDVFKVEPSSQVDKIALAQAKQSHHHPHQPENNNINKLINNNNNNNNNVIIKSNNSQLTADKDVLVYKKDHTVHVFLSSDAADVMGIVTAMNSVQSNTRYPVFFHLLVTEEALHILGPWLNNSALRDVHYEMKVFDESRIAHYIVDHGGREELAKPMNYARYFYAEMFPEVHGKAVHIDADVIVQGDIGDLLLTEIKSGHIIAVSEDCTGISKRFTQMENTLNKFMNFNAPSIKAAKLNPVVCSFNIGAYVWDVDRWRVNNITQQLMTWVILNQKENLFGNERGGGGSSPPMMIVMQKKYSRLDPLWHVRHLGHTPSSKVYSPAILSHAKLLHWNGHYKPWTGKAQQQKIWDKYYISDPSGNIHPIRKSK